MGLFRRAKKTEETQQEKINEPLVENKETPAILEQENTIKENQAKLEEITTRLENVREEYDTIVGNLMTVKKEYNEKKHALDSISQEYQKMNEEIKQNETNFQESKKISENLVRSEKKLEEIKREEEKVKTEYEKIKQKITESQNALHEIKQQQEKSQAELDEIKDKINIANMNAEKRNQDYNTEEEDNLANTQGFMKGESITKKSDSNSIIEAASAIVASLKLKLSSKERELDAVQQLLQKERDAHNETKNQLEQLKHTKENQE